MLPFQLIDCTTFYKLHRFNTPLVLVNSYSLCFSYCERRCSPELLNTYSLIIHSSTHSKHSSTALNHWRAYRGPYLDPTEPPPLRWLACGHRSCKDPCKHDSDPSPPLPFDLSLSQGPNTLQNRSVSSAAALTIVAPSGL